MQPLLLPLLCTKTLQRLAATTTHMCCRRRPRRRRRSMAKTANTTGLATRSVYPVSAEVGRAVVPRSVTAALALPIAAALDAPLPVTAAAVVCTGARYPTNCQRCGAGQHLVGSTASPELDGCLVEMQAVSCSHARLNSVGSWSACSEVHWVDTSSTSNPTPIPIPLSIFNLRHPGRGDGAGATGQDGVH